MIHSTAWRPGCALIASLLGLASSSLSRRAEAVRPFVTDDARITSKGQLEAEAWSEFVLSGGRGRPAQHVLGGGSFTEWFQLIAGGGMGLEPGGQLTITNPVIQPKFLVWRAEDNGIPGLSIATGVTLPVGRGELYDDATGLYVIAPLTSRFLDDWLLLHVNLGVTGAYQPADVGGREEEVSVRPYWGVGFDLGVGHPDARLIGEVYAGDPLDALGPDYAFQWGGRWLVSDYVNLDVTFGTQPRVEERVHVGNEWEYWGQVGVRLLFDLFTDGPGDPMGAYGMVRAPGARLPAPAGPPPARPSPSR